MRVSPQGLVLELLGRCEFFFGIGDLNWALYYCSPYMGETAYLKRNHTKKSRAKRCRDPVPMTLLEVKSPGALGCVTGTIRLPPVITYLFLLMLVYVEMLALVTTDVITPKGQGGGVG